MQTIQRICKSSSAIKNTGTDSDLLPSVTAMLFLVPETFSFTLQDVATEVDALKLFTDAVHAVKADRAYPLFGNQVPIQGLTNNKGGDTTVTLDDGTPIFLQYGTTSKVFYTTQGGLCFAKAIQSFNNANYRVIEIDIQGNIIAAKNSYGSYGGIKPASLFTPAIDFADFKNPAKTYFQVSYRPDVFLNTAVILSGGSLFLDLLGLTDLDLGDAGGSDATHLNVTVTDDCCGENASDAVIAAIVARGAAAFEVIDLADGSTTVITGVTSAGTAGSKHLVLAGAFTLGNTYLVSGTDANALYNDGAGLSGYEISNSVDITPEA